MRASPRPPPSLAAVATIVSAWALGASACTALAGIDDYAVGGGAGGSSATGTTHGGPGCLPTTCEKLGAACGTLPDGCGGTVVCPTTCVAPATCAGAGVANQCGCIKADCASQGKDCGEIDDRCGGTLLCGMGCPAAQTCGANQHPNVCGVGTCKTQTCAQQGVECGPAPIGNGCDGPLDCPPCQGGLVCVGGACKCPSTWSAKLSAKVLSGRLVVAGTSVVGVGADTTGKQAYAVIVDRCTGKVGPERSFQPVVGGVAAVSAELRDVLASPSAGTLLAVGAAATADDPGHGLFVELDPTTLAPSTQSFLFGSTGADTLASVAEASDGSLWMTGNAIDDKGEVASWIVKSAAHAVDACGTAGPPATGPGVAVAIVPQAQSPVNVLFRDKAAQGVVAGWNEGSCAPPAACGAGCAPGAITPFLVDPDDEPNGVAFFGMAPIGSVAYVIGTFCPLSAPTDCSGFVRAIDLASGALLPAQFTYDLGGTTEAFLGLAVDGDAVYVTGAQGLDLAAFGEGKLSSAKGVVVRLRRSDLVPDWIAVVPHFNVGVAVAADGPDALVVAGRTDAGSVLLRCGKSLCQ